MSSPSAPYREPLRLRGPEIVRQVVHLEMTEDTEFYVDGAKVSQGVFLNTPGLRVTEIQVEDGTRLIQVIRGVTK